MELDVKDARIVSSLQVMVQRVLSAKTHSHAKAGVLFAGLLKILPMFIIVIPGMVGRVLFPSVLLPPRPSLTPFIIIIAVGKSDVRKKVKLHYTRQFMLL